MNSKSKLNGKKEANGVLFIQHFKEAKKARKVINTPIYVSTLSFCYFVLILPISLLLEPVTLPFWVKGVSVDWPRLGGAPEMVFDWL